MFICIPLIEIGLFISVGGYLGVWSTIGLVLLTAIVGASLVRSQGLQTLMSVQDRLQQGELPAQQIVEGVMLAAAGVLLLVPGFMTDVLGMLVLLPAPRAALAALLMRKVALGGQFGGRHFDPSGDNTFEGEYHRTDDKDDKDDDHRLN
nr:FxsA family protein [Vibrio ostreicida]